jgi:hypothetical protein
VGVWWGNLWLQHPAAQFRGYSAVVAVVVLYSVVGSQATGLLVGNHIVDASSLVLFTAPWVQTLLNPFAGVVCGVSYRPISTGQLHESLVLASTSGLSTQWSGWGPLTHKVYGNLISKRASRLDAFSGYPIRT